MEESFGKDEVNKLLNKAYYNTASSSSSSSGSVEFIIQTTALFDNKVTSYKDNSFEGVETAKLRTLRIISSIGSEDDVILEPCVPGEHISGTSTFYVSISRAFHSGGNKDAKVVEIGEWNGNNFENQQISSIESI